MTTEQRLFLPEKNCTISSLLQPKGRPRSRTSPSPAVSGQLGPVCFMTQSISTLLDLNTKSQDNKQLVIRASRKANPVLIAKESLSVVHTLYVSVTHSFSVFLHSNLQVFFCLQFNKCLAAGTPLPCVGEVDAASIVDDFAICV